MQHNTATVKCIEILPPPLLPSRSLQPYKVFSEVEKKLEAEGGDAHQTGLKMDDIDYEIKVEAYDPVMLKEHVLHIQDNHIKGCLSAHPHLYTLG